MSDDHEFSANKIFLFLLIYTIAEVIWGMFFPFGFGERGEPRWALWGGLLICAFLKGYLIFAWFMHMKFEGWIVKGLIAPTIPLVAILIFANMPDTSLNDDLLYPIGSQLEVEMVPRNPGDDPAGEETQFLLRSTGQVTAMPDETPPKVKPERFEHAEDSGH